MINRTFLGLAMVFCGSSLPGQESILSLSLKEVMLLAREQSPMAIMAKHRFRGNYWEYRTYRARFLPNLDLAATVVDLNRTIISQTLDDGTDAFVSRKSVSYMGDLSLNQRISPTGGQVSVRSSLERIDQLGLEGTSSYLSSPISIELRQPLKGHNSFRWERKIEPLKYQAAQKAYIEALENVNRQASAQFFNLILAQVNLKIAGLNYSNNDTLFKIAQGRYNIGTIAENELLEMELAFLNAGTDLNEARIQLEVNKFQLRSFLGFNDKIDIELIIPVEIPELEVNVSQALEQAHNNSPDIIDLQRELLEANQAVARARAEKGLTADLFARYGLTQRSANLSSVYVNAQDQEVVNVGFEMPLVDWGLEKGNYRMAQSNQEVVRTNVTQAKIDFDAEVMLQVMQFNIQDDQLRIAAKADTIAQKRYEVTKQRFLIGNVDVLELNIALREKDDATRKYLSALDNYWRYYYNLRRLTLYDFERDIPLNEDFDALLD